MINNIFENELPDVQPYAFHVFKNAHREIIGYLAIDSLVNGQCGGGIRIVPDISRKELTYLARAMTLKYAFLNLPVGGAKAAIVARCANMPGEARSAYIKTFARNLKPFAGTYSPGKDIGVDDGDFRTIMSHMGLKGSDAVTDSAFYTAYTVFVCTEELGRTEGIRLAESTVAIEGYGNVGGHTGCLLSAKGARVVAVSNNAGAIYNPQGLDIPLMDRMKAAVGDRFIKQYEEARQIKKADLLTLPVDILVPCAFSWSIHHANAGKLKSKIIVCGANNPVTEDAKDILEHHRVQYFPDFVSNSGGVIGSMLERAYLDRDRIITYIENAFRPRVKKLIRRSKNERCPYDAVARDIAEKNKWILASARHSPGNRFYAFALNLYKRGRLPSLLIRLFAPLYLKRLMAAK